MEYHNVMMMNKWQVPTFGNWNYYDEAIPVSQYFESARQAGIVRRNFYPEEADLFKPPPQPYSYRKRTANQKQIKVDSYGKEQPRKEEVRKAPKAVDEDLYKIPPELLHRKSKRRMVINDFLKRCLGLSCIP